jgi:hypothetical protein
MRLVPRSLRRRGALSAASLVATIAAVLVVSGAPASADWQNFSGTPTCDCVVQDTKTNTYRAVFGYVNNSGSTGKITAGANNKLELTGGTTSAKTKPTEKFDKGTHKATFATGWLAKDTQVTWRIGGKTVTAHWNRPTCGKDVSLPAGGNGSGPLVALLFAGLIAGAVVLCRKRRSAVQP